LLDYVEKKLVGAEMRQDISNAKSNKGKINKIINRKKLPFGNSTAEVRNAINEIEINDLTSEQLKEYNSILSDAVKLGNKQTPQSIDDLLKKVESLNASIMDSKVTDSKVTDYKSFIDFLNTIKTSDFNDINDFKSTIRKYRNGQKMASKLFNDGIITESEYNMITEQMSNDYENLKVGLSEKQSEMKDEFINAGNKKLKEVTKIMSGKNNNIIPETEKGMVYDIIVKMQNPEVAKNLKLQDAEMYEYVMDNLTNGFINGVTHDFYRKVIDSYYNIDVPKNIEPLSNSKKFRNMAKVIDNNLAKWNGLLQSLNAYRISEFFGVLNNKFYNSIFREHIQDMVKSERFKQDILKPVLDASKKVLKESGIINKRKNFNDTMIKLAIIRTEKMWQNNLQKDLDGKTYEPNDATKPEHLKNYWDAVKSKNLKVADVKNSKNYEHTLRIWDKLKSDASLWKDGKKEVKEFDYQSAIDKLSKNEKELMNEIDKLSEKIKPYVESAALKHGKEFKDINDYDFQHFVIEHLRGKNLEPDFAGDLLREAQSTPTSQAKSTISRTMQPMAIRTDLINILNTHVSDVSQDFFVREKLLAKLRAINKADVGSKNFNKALQNTIIARATRSLDREIVKDPETQEVLNSTFGLISKALLGRITRMPQEIISNIDRNVFAQGFKSGVKAIFKNKIDDVYYDMLDEMIESNKSYSSLAEHINKSKTLGGKFIESIIVFADKRTVPPIFESEFNKSFKKQTGKEFNIEAYKTDFDYRLKNHDAIEMAKSDAIVRSQELFNTKTLLDNATHIMWFGRSFDKNNIVGKTGYFLQSFSHNEAKQMMKSAKRMFSGDRKEFARGLRDSLAIVTSNYIYMQLGFLISSMTKNIWSKLTDDEDGNMAESFNDGLNEYYDNYLNSDKIAKSTLASLIALSSGKYNYAVAGLTGLLMGVINDSKNIKKETKDDIEDYGKGMYIRPISFKSSRIYEVGRFHPIFNELINLGDLIFVQTPDIANDIYKGDVDAIELGYVFNSIIRLTYVNPISNQIQNDLKRANYNNEKLKKEKEKKDKKSGNKW
jgi:hypothetical protein